MRLPWCFLANISLLTSKRIFAFYQMYVCFLSNIFSFLYLCFPVQNPIQLAKNIFFCFVRQDGEISIAV